MAEQDSSLKIRILRALPWATIVLIAIMVVVFQIEINCFRWEMINDLIVDFGFSYKRFLLHPIQDFPTVFSSILIHGSWRHLIGNALFLSLFALLVENKLGRAKYLILFFVCGAAAALIDGYVTQSDFRANQYAFGASGAISGVSGAYFVLSPLRNGVPIWRKILSALLPGLWFLSDIRAGFFSMDPRFWLLVPANVGHWAHVGGFVVGALLMAPFLVAKNQPS